MVGGVGAVRQQVKPNVDPNLCCHLASLGPIELTNGVWEVALKNFPFEWVKILLHLWWPTQFVYGGGSSQMITADSLIEIKGDDSHSV